MEILGAPSLWGASAPYVNVLLCQFKECLVKAKSVFRRGVSEAIVI